MERITVFENGSTRNGKIFRIPKVGKLDPFLNEIRIRFGKPGIKYLFTAEGAEIIDADLIRNNETLYVAEEGEEFKPIATSVSAVNSISMEPRARAMVVDPTFGQDSDFVQLNVGGTAFVTSRTSLRSGGQDSMLAKMFDPDSNFKPSSMDSNGAYMLDRDPKYFGPILNFLRTGKIIIDNGINPDGVVEEANFFGIRSFMEQYNLQIEQKNRQAKEVEKADEQRRLDNEANNMNFRIQELLLENRNMTVKEFDLLLRKNIGNGKYMAHCEQTIISTLPSKPKILLRLGGNIAMWCRARPGLVFCLLITPILLCFPP